MNVTEVLELAGGYGLITAIIATTVVALIRAFPGALGRVYSDRVAVEKERREEERKLRDADIARQAEERAERRADRQQLVQLVENNTKAMVELTSSLHDLQDGLAEIKASVGAVVVDVEYVYKTLEIKRS